MNQENMSLPIHASVASLSHRLLNWIIPSANAALPGAGPGGPILVVTANCPSCGTFNDYYPEILLNEGFNAFSVVDIGAVNATLLGSHDLVILGSTPLSGSQVAMFSNWVNGGGNLIAMRPDNQLAAILGITGTGTTLAEGYLKVNTGSPTGNGIVDRVMQFHGTADRYTVNGATVLATLYSDATTATPNPALTINNFGSGQAAGFTYDFATSLVYTRQGNPAWAAEERDGSSPIRSNDKFFGDKEDDPQADWVDLENLVDVPQADEQQRLLANLIAQMNLAKKPLPRFWYFPRGEKAVVVMTGDDHGNNGTGPRFDQFKAMSPAGCSVADWECVRGTSYMYTSTPMSDAEAAAYNADGFEIGLHVSSACADYTPSQLDSFYAFQINEFKTKYSSIPAPITQRHHCIAWTDWVSGATVQLNHGIRLDTTYYFYPATWVKNRPGFFNGSAMPMRFSDLSGNLVDVYLAQTQLTDESGQTYPFTIDTLLDRAIGAEGYFGAYVINAHTDAAQILEATTVVHSAQARSVPVISSVQLLEWLDGRNGSSFGNITWDNTTLNFTVTTAPGSNGIYTMVPVNSGSGVIVSVSDASSTVAYSIDTIKGIQYAFFPVSAGTYSVTYGADTTPPSVAVTEPASGANNVSQQPTIKAIFNESINPATISGSSFELRDANGQAVAATIGYDSITRTASLRPNSLLDRQSGYTVHLSTAVTDIAGNAMAAPFSWSFTVGDGPQCPCAGFDGNTVPNNPSSNDQASIEVGVKFRSDFDGFISAIRFYQANPGTYTVNLWNSSGQRLATAAYSAVNPGWQQAPLATPVEITANTTYVASYHSPNGRYAVDEFFFVSAGVENSPIRLLADGVSGPNGVYSYGPTSLFPTSTFRSSNYWVDVVIGTTLPPDTTRPTVVTQSPEDGANEILLTSAVTATFSEAMDAASIDGSSFELRDSNNNLVAANVNYDAGSNTATLTPLNQLSENTVYTATLRGGANDPRVKDLAGNALVADNTWSFTTISADSISCTVGSSSLWSDTVVPTVASEADSSSVELGVKFSSSADGFICGIRFYKGITNTGTHVGSLWSENGQLLASATFQNETASGWQRVDFANPVAVSANTVYVASYLAPVGQYAVDSGYFAVTGTSNGPLQALSNLQANGNGLYLYGAGGFPVNSFLSANYWVDVVFTTSIGPDTTAPTITSQNPVNGAADVSLDAAVSVVFSEALDVSTITASSFGLRDASNNLVPATIGYEANTKTATLSPSSPLVENSAYTVTVAGGENDPRVKDTAGNALAADAVWSFTTIEPGVISCSVGSTTLWPESTTPSVASENDSGSVELGVRFRSSQNGFVCGIRFYKGSSNSGTHIGNLWTENGQLLASATFQNETASGWQQVDFANPVAITANTNYVASYFAPVGGYSVDANYFATSGTTNGPLHALSNLESGGNGLYLYGAGGFPINSFLSTNYWVDVVFTTSIGPDTTAPNVVSRNPGNGAADIALDSQINVGFDEAIDAATIDATTFELRDSGNNLISASISYDANSQVATLTPANLLAGNSTYAVRVRGGDSGPRVRDLAGNALSTDVNWSFTTLDPNTVSCAVGSTTLWPETATPSVVSEADSASVELGVKFRSDVDGFICGIRFYKGASNSGTHIGKLWSANGQLLESATFQNESASGWQQVNFGNPVAVTANTVYVASYLAPVGQYSVDSNFFAAGGLSNGPLHALSEAESGGNGVYLYGNGGFPVNSFLSSNYWVDVVFTTNIGPDTTPPTVTARNPDDGATGVVPSTGVTVTFNESINPATLNASTFMLLDAPDSPVSSSISYNASTRVATLAPNGALAESTTYTVLLRGDVNGAADLAGNALVGDVTWSFTTGIDPCAGASNPIVCENSKLGNPASEWDINGAGHNSIQGFATDISVDRGDTVRFKIDTPASDYRLDIYRMGYYGGLGARRIATVQPSAALPQSQPACLTDASGLVDCGNWAESASWSVPADATSGIYFAKAVREDPGTVGLASHIIFIVRDDASTSNLLFQTSDTTWQAYNNYGGNNLYGGNGPGTGLSGVGRAYKVSYNRPFVTRAVDNGQDWVFNAEYPMIRWLEANGYDVSYSTGIDSERRGNLISNHQVFLSVGHDEYWSEAQRTHVETARDAGVNLAFFSGNEIFWKTRWETSIDSSGTPFRTLVCYKETHEGAKIDPLPNVWTGTWRDPRFSPPADGGRPENALSGTVFTVNAGATTSIIVPEVDGKMRFWRNTSIENLTPGTQATLPFGTLGYEWDEDLDNGFRPAGLVRLSTTTVANAPVLTDFGSVFGSGTANHALTLYRAASGAVVFGAGTVQWSWGLDSNHDRGNTPASTDMQQATVNLMADMGVQPATLQSGLVAAVASSDNNAPTSTITSPGSGANLATGSTTVITGTAVEAGGGRVGGVEVSVDGGQSWHPASGRENWTYSWTTPNSAATVTILSRAVDDSLNMETPSQGISVSVN